MNSTTIFFIRNLFIVNTTDYTDYMDSFPLAIINYVYYFTDFRSRFDPKENSHLENVIRLRLLGK